MTIIISHCIIVKSRFMCIQQYSHSPLIFSWYFNPSPFFHTPLVSLISVWYVVFPVVSFKMNIPLRTASATNTIQLPQVPSLKTLTKP